MRSLGWFAVLVALSVADVAVAASAFDPGSPGLQRAAELARIRGLQVETTVATAETLGDVAEAASTLFIATRDVDFTAAEADAVNAFLDRGGHVLLMTKAPIFDAVLGPRHLRILPAVLVLDATGPAPIHAQYSGASFLLVGTQAAPLRLLPGFDGTVVASTGPFGYAAGTNETVEAANEAARFPVLASVPQREGGFLFVATDPGLLSNVALDNVSAENQAFWLALVDRTVPPDGRLIFDESRHAANGLVFASGSAERLQRWFAGHAWTLWGLAGASLALLWAIARFAPPEPDVDAPRTPHRIVPRTTPHVPSSQRTQGEP